MSKITILCSGFGLGFYIPGIMLRNQLKNRKIDAEIDVFEHYMEVEKKEDISISKEAYHQNFARAIVASKIPLDIRKSIDYESVERLLDKWKKEKRDTFILLSGHWIYIIDMYRKVFGNPLKVDLLYVDSSYAPSWKSFYKLNKDYHHLYNDVYLYDIDKNNIRCTIGVDGYKIKRFQLREKRVVVHGGGWGMGTYQEKIPELLTSGYQLDVIAYKEAELLCSQEVRYMMNDPSWCAWEKDQTGAYDFPPYIIKDRNGILKKETPKTNHWLLDVTNEAKAIVAKPGAGTLLDSFITETPLILLEPFGAHEKTNLQLWENLGFGIKYEKWVKNNYSEELLVRMHQNIASKRHEIMQYADMLR